MSTNVKQSHEADRQPWQTPTIKPAGTVAQLLQSGGGKPSVSSADPGEPRKQSPVQG